MRKIKIRGQNRKLKEIEAWRLKNLNLNLKILNTHGRDKAEIIVHPWCDLAIRTSYFPQPRGQVKIKMLSGLLDIYESWKRELDSLGISYYLKIWLFEPRFSSSQVVCAISDNADYYERIFYKPETSKTVPFHNYGILKNRIQHIKWDYHLDEDTFNNDEVGELEHYATRQDFEYSKKWLNRLMKKQHRTVILKEPFDNITEYYSFKRGDLWIGG